MEKDLKQYDSDLKDANGKILTKRIKTVSKSYKCNQCEYAALDKIHLRRHLKTHRGAKPKKCNQCDYASSRVSNLRSHLKTHSGKNF